MASRRTLQIAAALLLYSATAVYLTWPLITDLGSSTYLFPSIFATGGGDLAGSIAHLRELVDGHHNPFGAGRIADFNAPYGLEIRWALNVASFPSVIFLYALTLAVGATAAMNLFVLLGYVASGLAMFLFVRRLTGNTWISLLAGWAFAFYPFAVVTAEHPAFVHGWPFVLVMWRVLEVWEKPTVRNGLWAGAAAILAVAWTPHYLVLAGVTYGVITAVALVGAGRSGLRRALPAHAAGAALAFGFVLLVRILVALSPAQETFGSTSLVDLASTSARPLMYLIPSADTLLGGQFKDDLIERGWRGVERTLYVGWSVLALAAIGTAAAFAKRLVRVETRAAALALAAAVAAVAFAAPPEAEVLGLTVKLPSWFVFQVTPGLRLLSRFVIPLMAALCVLAALGLATLVRILPARAGWAALAIATLVVPLDLWNRFPDRTHTFETPSIYGAVPAGASGNLAEFPLLVRDRRWGEHDLDLFNQDAHGLPDTERLLPRGPDERRALAIAGLDDPATPGVLATLECAVRTAHSLCNGPRQHWTGKPGAGFEPGQRRDGRLPGHCSAGSVGVQCGTGFGFRG